MAEKTERLFWFYGEPCVLRILTAGPFKEVEELREYIQSKVNIGATNNFFASLSVISQNDEPALLTSSNCNDKDSIILCLPSNESLEFRARSPKGVDCSWTMKTDDTVLSLKNKLASCWRISGRFFDIVYRKCPLVDTDLLIDVCFNLKDRISSIEGNKIPDRNITMLKQKSKRNPTDGEEYFFEVREQAGPYIILNIDTLWQKTYVFHVNVKSKVFDVLKLIFAQAFRDNAIVTAREQLIKQTFFLSMRDGSQLDSDGLLIDCPNMTGHTFLRLRHINERMNWSKNVIVFYDDKQLCDMACTVNLWLFVALEVHRVTKYSIDDMMLKMSNGRQVNNWSSISVLKSDNPNATIAVTLSYKRSLVVDTDKLDVIVNVAQMPSVSLKCIASNTIGQVKAMLINKGILDAGFCHLFYKKVKLRDDSHLSDYEWFESLSFDLRLTELPVCIIFEDIAKKVVVDCQMPIRRHFVNYIEKLFNLTSEQFDLIYCGRLVNLNDNFDTVGSIFDVNASVYVRRSSIFQLQLFQEQSHVANFSFNNGSIRLSYSGKRLLLKQWYDYFAKFFEWKHRASSCNEEREAHSSKMTKTDGRLQTVSEEDGTDVSTKFHRQKKPVRLTSISELDSSSQTLASVSSYSSATETVDRRQTKENTYRDLPVKDPYLLWYWNKTLFSNKKLNL